MIFVFLLTTVNNQPITLLSLYQQLLLDGWMDRIPVLSSNWFTCVYFFRRTLNWIFRFLSLPGCLKGQFLWHTHTVNKCNKTLESRGSHVFSLCVNILERDLWLTVGTTIFSVRSSCSVWMLKIRITGRFLKSSYSSRILPELWSQSLLKLQRSNFTSYCMTQQTNSETAGPSQSEEGISLKTKHCQQTKIPLVTHTLLLLTSHLWPHRCHASALRPVFDWLQRTAGLNCDWTIQVGGGFYCRNYIQIHAQW